MSLDGPPTMAGVPALAERLTAPLGDRWMHLQAVGRRAEALGEAVDPADRDLLAMAGWLHDIGYSPEIGHLRFHPIDGARYLESEGFPRRLVCLVAHHSAARFEADERGLSDELAVFELEDSPVMDALVAADMTIGPQGQPLRCPDRLDEILTRYGPDTVVYRSITKARPTLIAAVDRTVQRLTDVDLVASFS